VILATEADLDALDFAKLGGLVPVIAQDARSGEVLMLGFADRAALVATRRDGELWFWSRTRLRLWRKGETSGNHLRVVSLHADCDRDAVLARVEPQGPTCHTGAHSCFGAPPVLAELADVIADRAAARGATSTASPDEVPTSYTRRLLEDSNLRLKKLGEEATELALACAAGDPQRVAEEGADLLYHLLVAAAASGVSLDALLGVLAGRRR
jgi:phosphoribosyl-AMP cyclohydrolase / phosphoribosyl-ATP pyrophosphohydrolase